MLGTEDRGRSKIAEGSHQAGREKKKDEGVFETGRRECFEDFKIRYTIRQNSVQFYTEYKISTQLSSF